VVNPRGRIITFEGANETSELANGSRVPRTLDRAIRYPMAATIATIGPNGYAMTEHHSRHRRAIAAALQPARAIAWRTARSAVVVTHRAGQGAFSGRP